MKYIKNFRNLKIFVDTLLHEVGAKWGDQIFSCTIPDILKEVGSIVHFEAANILLTLQCWCKSLRNKTVLIWCDNLAVVNVSNYYKVRDPLLMAILRSVWLYTAAFNMDLQIKHIKGLNNVYADILSRWSLKCLVVLTKIYKYLRLKY